MKAAAVALALLVAFGITTVAFGHAGEIHNYMGTITMLNRDGSFLLKKTDGKTMHVHVAKTTTYLHAAGHAAKASELKVGSRVVARISKDGKTALTVKFAPVKKK